MTVTTTLASYVCKSSQYSLNIYPTFKKNSAAFQEFSNGTFLYHGGRIAFERTIFNGVDDFILTTGIIIYDGHIEIRRRLYVNPNSPH